MCFSDVSVVNKCLITIFWKFLTQTGHEMTLPPCCTTLPQNLILSEWGFILNGCRRWWIASFSWDAKCKSRKNNKHQKELKLSVDGVSKLGVYWYMFSYICSNLNGPIPPMTLSFMKVIFFAPFLFFVLFRSHYPHYTQLVCLVLATCH